MAIKIEQQYVRAAILAAHGLDAETAAFKAAFQFFRRSGAGLEQPGKGQRQHYDARQQSRLLACFELIQMGLASSLALELIENESLAEAFDEAQRSVALYEAGDDDVILVIRAARFASARWGAAGKAQQPIVMWCRLGELKTTGAAWLSESTGTSANLIAANLSARLRRYHDAIITRTEL